MSCQMIRTHKLDRSVSSVSSEECAQLDVSITIVTHCSLRLCSGSARQDAQLALATAVALVVAHSMSRRR